MPLNYQVEVDAGVARLESKDWSYTAVIGLTVALFEFSEERDGPRFQCNVPF